MQNTVLPVKNGSAVQVTSPKEIQNIDLNDGNSYTATYTRYDQNDVLTVQATANVAIGFDGNANTFPLTAGGIIQFSMANIKTVQFSAGSDATVYLMVG